jgi:predicted acyl esterase
MDNDRAIFVPACPFDEETEEGYFSRFEAGTRTLPAGFQVDPRFLALPVDIVLDKDVAVTLRDGVTIYVDVLRPPGAKKVPVIVAWSPYGKSRGNHPRYTQIFDLLGMETSAVSGLMKFEGPDPAFWCAHGYAVCNPDPRGSFYSEGDIRVWSRKEGEDYHDVIEWLGVQDWCSGKVGLTGNSYLAISQWFAAAEQPPHLAAIAPWEGMICPSSGSSRLALSARTCARIWLPKPNTIR